MTNTTNRLRAIVISLVLIAFVAGASAGVVVGRMTAPRIQLRATLGDMSGVFDRLELTDAQRRQADSILVRSAPRSHAIMMEVAERLRGVADSVDTELRAILTPAQRVRLDSLRTDARVLLKRKIVGPGGTRVDTVLDTSTARRR